MNNSAVIVYIMDIINILDDINIFSVGDDNLSTATITTICLNNALDINRACGISFEYDCATINFTIGLESSPYCQS